MYIQHFGLAQYPFSLTPNTRYFLKLPVHQGAFDFIMAGLEGDSCFTKLTGEVGTGKTMLCRKVLNALGAHQNRYVTAFIPNPVLSEEGIMHAIAEELGLSFQASSSYYEILKLITEELIRLALEGRRLVLFIDEAQAMPEESLQALRLLSTVEIQSDRPYGLKVILFGQPELDELLQRPVLRELNRDLNNSYLLVALDKQGLQAYLDHRLNKAGYNGSNLFSQKSIDMIYNSSKGIPRLVNILAHKAMMVAFGKGDYTISDTHMELAIEDTKSVQ